MGKIIVGASIKHVDLEGERVIQIFNFTVYIHTESEVVEPYQLLLTLNNLDSQRCSGTGAGHNLLVTI